MARRNANGEGSIYKRADGRWEAAIYTRTTAGTRKRIRLYAATRAEAHAKLTEFKTKILNGFPVPDRTWKLGEYLDYWLEQIVTRNKRAGTYAQCETMVRLYLKPALGKTSLTHLSVTAVQMFLNEKLTAGYSIPTAIVIRKVLSAALTHAMREELLSRNVARLAVVPPYKAPKVAPWTANETTQFLRETQGETLHPAYTLLALYGLRRGELLGLRWCDVDLTGRVLHIRQQLQRVGKSLFQGPVKTDAGNRDEPLEELGVQALAAQREQQRQARLAAGDQWEGTDTPDALVFTTRTGHPIEPRNFLRSFQTACVRAGVRVVTVHRVRHANATLQKRLNVSDRDIQAGLGHSRVSTTQELYQYVDLTDRRIAIKKVEQALTGSQEKNDQADGLGRPPEVDSRQDVPSTANLWDKLVHSTSGGAYRIRTDHLFHAMLDLKGSTSDCCRDNSIRFSRNNQEDRIQQIGRAAANLGRRWKIGAVAVDLAVKKHDARERANTTPQA
jgi:integrase